MVTMDRARVGSRLVALGWRLCLRPCVLLLSSLGETEKDDDFFQYEKERLPKEESRDDLKRIRRSEYEESENDEGRITAGGMDLNT